MTSFQVKFSVPAVGTFASPLPIAGDGTLEMGVSGVKLSAFRPPANKNGCLTLLPFGLGALAAVLLAQAFAPADLASPIGIGLGAGILGPRLTKVLSAKENSQATDQAISWTAQLDQVVKVQQSGQSPSEMRLQLKQAQGDGQTLGKREALFESAQFAEILEAFKGLGVKT